MRTPRRLAVTAGLLVGALTVTPHPGTATSPPTAVDADDCSRELLFEFFRGLIMVQVEIGESPPLDFILDSGANATAVNDVYLANALNLHYVNTGQARGVGLDRVPVLVAPDVALRSGGRLLFRTDLVIHHVQPVLERYAGRSIHGLLGADLFEAWVVELDPVLQRMVLHDPEHFSYLGDGVTLRLDVKNRWPLLEGRVTTADGKRVKTRLLVDTGSPAKLAVIEGSHRRLRLPDERRVTEIVGVGGVSEVHMALVPRLELGGVVLEDLDAPYIHRAAIPASRALGRLHGVLGTGFLRDFHVFIDVPHRRLILEPVEPSIEPVDSQR